MIENILAGVIANFIFFTVTILVGWSAFLLARRRRLLKFFGVDKSKRMVVYLSNIRVVSGGSLGVDDKPRMYNGTTVTVGEAVQGSLFARLFSYLIPGFVGQPGILKYLLVSDVKVSIQPSPLKLEELDKTSTIITFGSPWYNMASQWVQNKLVPRMAFDMDNWTMKVDGLPNITDSTQAFVQRRFDAENNRWVFYTAGLSELGTIGAAYFLVTNWRSLYKKHGATDSFSHMIAVNPQNYQDARIVI